MLSGDDAVWHIMRVSGGFDSLVVGEGQILSQVRQCHLHSIEEDGCGGKVLSRLLNQAVAAGSEFVLRLPFPKVPLVFLLQPSSLLKCFRSRT
jgi:glutamyl-tRNA reductase